MRFIASAVTALSLATLALGQASSSQQVQSSSQQQQSSAAGSASGSAAGSSAAATTAAPSVVVITSYQQSMSLSGPNRAQVTVSIPVVISSTVAQAQPTGSSAGNGSQQSGGATSSTSTQPSITGTASATIGVNGQGGQVAPSPGGSNSAMGPDDDYISGASQLAMGGVTVLLGLGTAVVLQMM